MFDGRALAEHARELLLHHVEQAVIVGPDGAIPDLPCPGLGPLGGIAGALQYAKGLGFTSILTIACDMPRLPRGLLDALLRRAPAYCPEAPVLGHLETASTTALIAHILSDAGLDVQIGGNIGTAILSLEPPAPGRYLSLIHI